MRLQRTGFGYTVPGALWIQIRHESDWRTFMVLDTRDGSVGCRWNKLASIRRWLELRRAHWEVES